MASNLDVALVSLLIPFNHLNPLGDLHLKSYLIIGVALAALTATACSPSPQQYAQPAQYDPNPGKCWDANDGEWEDAGDPDCYGLEDDDHKKKKHKTYATAPKSGYGPNTYKPKPVNQSGYASNGASLSKPTGAPKPVVFKDPPRSSYSSSPSRSSYSSSSSSRSSSSSSSSRR